MQLKYMANFNSNDDLSKQDLYEGVKLLVEQTNPHIHLTQQKLYTLFSISFQYLLFLSTKKPGAYIIRVEDGVLAEKLAKKAKDPSTRKFMQSLLIPRKFKYDRSVFYLDYFHLGSWNLTSEIPKEKIQASIIVKNTSNRPMLEVEEEEQQNLQNTLPSFQYLSTLLSYSPKTITIAFEENFHEHQNSLQEVTFPFIKKGKDKTFSDVVLNEDLNWDEEN